MVTAELTARKYAGVVRVEVSADMPADLRGWLGSQLDADPADFIAVPGLLSLHDLMELPVEDHAEQRDPPHEPVTHQRRAAKSWPQVTTSQQVHGRTPAEMLR
jgi:polyphosphate kinase